MKKILITGGAGFIGSHLAIKLIEKGYHVIVMDNLSTQIHGNNPEKTSPLYQSILGKVEFVYGSVINALDFEKVISECEVIVHLAAETGTGQSMYEIKRYSDVNVGGTALMLDILTNKKHSVNKIIIASSRAIYGEGRYFCKKDGIVFPNSRLNEDLQNGFFECKCPLCEGNLDLLSTTEDSKMNPTSIYGISKLNQEQMVLTVGKALNIPSVVFRYQNVYGPGQSLTNPYTGILSIFSNLFRNNKDINVFEDGKESRDFVYIDDVVNATLFGIEKKESDYEIFNVGSGHAIEVKTIAGILKNIYNSSSKINITGNYRLGDIRHNFADLKKIQNLLNFCPNYTFKEGIVKFASWVDQQDTFVFRYNESLNEMKTKGLFK